MLATPVRSRCASSLLSFLAVFSTDAMMSNVAILEFDTAKFKPNFNRSSSSVVG